MANPWFPSNNASAMSPSRFTVGDGSIKILSVIIHKIFSSILNCAVCFPLSVVTFLNLFFYAHKLCKWYIKSYPSTKHMSSIMCGVTMSSTICVFVFSWYAFSSAYGLSSVNLHIVYYSPEILPLSMIDSQTLSKLLRDIHNNYSWICLEKNGDIYRSFLHHVAFGFDIVHTDITMFTSFKRILITSKCNKFLTTFHKLFWNNLDRINV